MKLIDYLVNPKSGIFTHIEEGFDTSPAIPMYAYTLFRKQLIDIQYKTIIDADAFTLGYSFTSRDSALISAIGEGIERYCSALTHGHRLIYGSYNALSNQGYYLLNPEIITRNTKEQIDRYKLNVKIGKEIEYYWVKGIDQIELKEIWIPASLVFLTSNEKKVRKHLIRDMTSTGLAAGSSIEHAKTNAILECIERDAFMIMWLNKLQMPRVNINSIPSETIHNVSKRCEELELELNIIDITMDFNIPTYFVLIKNNNSKYPYIQVGAKTHLDPIKAMEGAVAEASMLFNLQSKYKMTKVVDITNPLNIRGFADHLKYYASGEGLEYLEFLTRGKTIDFSEKKFDHINCYSDLIKRLNIEGSDVYFVDLTTEDIRSLDLYVVRVIIPQMAFLEVKIPMLECERLYTIPEKLGYPTSTVFNQMPHPFP